MPDAMKLIDRACADLSDAHQALTAELRKAEADMARVQMKHRKPVQKAADVYKVRLATLQALVTNHPEVFDRPKSRTLHGVKAGYRKGTGKVTFDDADKVVARIRAKLAAWRNSARRSMRRSRAPPSP